MKLFKVLTLTASLALSLAGCGGGGGDGSPPAPPPPPPPPPITITKADAYQFLNQATFGATEAEADRVIAMGYEAWIDDQLAAPISLQEPYLRGLPRPTFLFEMQPDRVDIWFRNVVFGEDQLRQRVAFALSEVLVVSQLGALEGSPYGLANYYDMLTINAFGNYRDIMQGVTLHPMMGVYLSMLGNEKPNPALNIRPDENYARELMQLFSIGLVELNNDGTEVLGMNGLPVPTYDQAVIEGFAHVFTGWTWFGAATWTSARQNDDNQSQFMVHFPAFHDTDEKLLLNGVVLPANQTGQQDLSQALDNVFNHPNVGPFIAIRLIQRLTTSNPSPGYVDRVASVFNNNGQGVRGDMEAVVKAILLDPEARPDMPMEIDGKLKEPLLRVTQLWRAYNATSESGRFPLVASYILFGQGPLQSPSVFNFFSPFYAPPGEIRNSSLVAPELQIATEYQNTLFTNYMFYQTFSLNQTNNALQPDDIYIDFSEEMVIADDPDALINMVADKLLAGEISDTLRTEITGMLAQIDPVGNEAIRAAETIYFVVTSPEYAYQR